MTEKLTSTTLIRIIVAVIAGSLIGSIANESTMKIIVTIQYIIGQLIAFMIPLIVLAFVGSSIAQIGGVASQMLGRAILLAYSSSIGAALFAMVIGYNLIPSLAMANNLETTRTIPPLIFKLNIPPIMGVMSALVLAIMVGLASVWSNAQNMATILSEFRDIVSQLVNRILIPALPLFMAANFASQSFQGVTSAHLPLFIRLIGALLLAHFAWLTFLYLTAAIVSQISPFRVLRHYAAPYFTALGTMSSAATLPVALEAMESSKVVSKDVVDFSIPIFSNIHLCGSILTEVLFVMAISQLLYGTIPTLPTMLLFIVLLSLFAIGAPGVPGGTVIASLGIVTSVLGFDAAGTALLLTIFALQDSFGTACNIVGDGALTMMMGRKFT